MRILFSSNGILLIPGLVSHSYCCRSLVSDCQLTFEPFVGSIALTYFSSLPSPNKSVILFNAVFATGWGPIPWLFPPEILGEFILSFHKIEVSVRGESNLRFFHSLGLRFRAKGTSASTATNWLFNFIVGEITPVLQQSIKWRRECQPRQSRL